jgi:cytochrome c biogenesis protein CcmG, thiol:disulfide interchange protein DsbE
MEDSGYLSRSSVWQAFRVTVRSPLIAIATLALLAGCGGSPRSDAPPPGSVIAAFKGSPPPLASLHAQANRLLSGGPRAFESRLGALRGYPVVVNMWASWCQPCQAEFPIYQKVAVADGKQVAFLGIDAKDQNGAASSFLHKLPVTYPSYTDPQGRIAAAIHSYAAYPQTFYFNRQGKLVYDKAGPYLNSADLEKDIRFYLHVGKPA